MTYLNLSPGSYWIGDPGYVFPLDDLEEFDPWSDLLETTGFFQVKNYYKDKHIEVWASPTTFGDGLYNSGNKLFSVDSGLLGIVSVGTIQYLKSDIDKLNRNGWFVIFDTSTKVFQENGVFHFGDIIIDTGYQETMTIE